MRSYVYVFACDEPLAEEAALLRICRKKQITMYRSSMSEEKIQKFIQCQNDEKEQRE